MKYLQIIKIFILFFLLNCSAIASFEKKEAGAKEQALGNAIVAVRGDPFAVYYNPANIIFIDGINIYAGYRNFYGIPGRYIPGTHYKLFSKITFQKTGKSLTMASFIFAHFMNCIVNCVIVQLLCLSGQVFFTLTSAMFCFYSRL